MPSIKIHTKTITFLSLLCFNYFATVGCQNLSKPIDYSKGERGYNNLMDRVCGDLEVCWKFDGYDTLGEKILTKGDSSVTDWGDTKTLMLPQDEWGKLTQAERQDLADYLKNINIGKIIVGRIQPQRLGDGSYSANKNVMAVDETVWEK